MLVLLQTYILMGDKLKENCNGGGAFCCHGLCSLVPLEWSISKNQYKVISWSFLSFNSNGSDIFRDNSTPFTRLAGWFHEENDVIICYNLYSQHITTPNQNFIKCLYLSVCLYTGLVYMCFIYADNKHRWSNMITNLILIWNVRRCWLTLQQPGSDSRASCKTNYKYMVMFLF